MKAFQLPQISSIRGKPRNQALQVFEGGLAQGDLSTAPSVWQSSSRSRRTAVPGRWRQLEDRFTDRDLAPRRQGYDVAFRILGAENEKL